MAAARRRSAPSRSSSAPGSTRCRRRSCAAPRGPYEDLIKPHGWSFAGGGSGGSGITTLPHLRDLIVVGPFRATGVSDTPSRQRIFSCRPTTAADEAPCARQIITRLGAQAYRRPMTAAEIDRLMPFYQRAAAKNGFEAGITASLEAILASPYFIFRIEREREARPGSTVRVADVDLASRLSFFLWGTPPDKELLSLATSGKLSDPRVLEAQAKRMLADERSGALGTRFAAQWLRLQDVDKVHPDPNFYPNFDENLAAAMRRETVLFFNSLVQDDRSFLDLYRADYTFVNERLAQHYGIPGVAGTEFRKVQYPGRLAPRPARPGQRAGPDLARQPHLAGAARQVGDGGADRRAAAGAAAERADAGRHRRRQGRPHADHA